MLLGDGCLHNSGVQRKKIGIYSRKHKEKTLKKDDVFFCMNHGSQQRDYAIWKSELINNIFREKNLPKRCTFSTSKKFDKKYNKTYIGIYVKFRWADYLRHLRKWTHKEIKGKERKNVEYLLSQMTKDIHTAIWFMDDGNEKRKQRKSVTGKKLGWDNPYYRLCTYSFTKGQNQLIKEWFERIYKVSPNIKEENRKKRGENCYILYFSVSDSKKLFQVLYPYFMQTESMRNKFWLSFEKYLSEIQDAPLGEDIVQTI
jgi:hypothetical protein